MTSPITLTLVESCALLRDTLTYHFEQQPDLSLTEVTDDIGHYGDFAKRLIANGSHVLLLDVDPQLHQSQIQAAELAEAVQLAAPTVKVIVTSRGRHSRFLTELLRTPVYGHVCKDKISIMRLLQSVRQVAKGSLVLCTHSQQMLINATSAITPRLSSREMDILQRIASMSRTGESRRGIAKLLNISKGTLDSHVAHILFKFDLPTVEPVLLRCREWGWVE